MNNQLYQTIIANSLEFIPPNLVHRDQTVPFIDSKASILVGMRRVGKTSLAWQLMTDLFQSGVPRDQVLYLNLEDDRLPQPFNGTELSTMLDLYYRDRPALFDSETYLFLDEIQEVEGWERSIRRFLDSRRIKICLTGSSSKMLSSDIATSMRGRSVSFEVWPFSFREFCRARDRAQAILQPDLSTQGQAFFRQALLEYLQTGGFPEVQHLDPFIRNAVLQEYREVLLSRDLIERHSIKSVPVLEYLLKFLLSNYAGRLSVNKVFKDLKSQSFGVGRNTLYHYIDLIEDTFAAFMVPLFTESIRKQSINPKKIYCIDTGLGAAYSLGITEKLGALFENLIYIDLRRRHYKVCYYLTASGQEVDFVASRPGEPSKLFQVCWDISQDSVRRREQSALEEASNELGLAGELITPENYGRWFLELEGNSY